MPAVTQELEAEAMHGKKRAHVDNAFRRRFEILHTDDDLQAEDLLEPEEDVTVEGAAGSSSSSAPHTSSQVKRKNKADVRRRALKAARRYAEQEEHSDDPMEVPSDEYAEMCKGGFLPQPQVHKGKKKQLDLVCAFCMCLLACATIL